jgi:hypothetical protein
MVNKGKYDLIFTDVSYKKTMRCSGHLVYENVRGNQRAFSNVKLE